MINENPPKYDDRTRKFILSTLGIAALSGFVGWVGYQAGKLEGRAELYRATAYHIVDTNNNGVVEDTELAVLARELPKYDGQSTIYDSSEILTRNGMQEIVDGASNSAWEKFVKDGKGLLSKL